MLSTVCRVPIAGQVVDIVRSSGPLFGPSGRSTTSLYDPAGSRIYIDPAMPDAYLPAVIAAAVSHAWMEAVRDYTATLQLAWERWERDTDGIDDEIHEDEAGDIFASFDRLIRLGVKFDPTFIEKFKALDPVPSEADEGNPFKGLTLNRPRGRSSESFIEDDEFEDGGDGRDDDREDAEPVEDNDPCEEDEPKEDDDPHGERHYVAIDIAQRHRTPPPAEPGWWDVSFAGSCDARSRVDHSRRKVTLHKQRNERDGYIDLNRCLAEIERAADARRKKDATELVTRITAACPRPIRSGTDRGIVVPALTWTIIASPAADDFATTEAMDCGYAIAFAEAPAHAVKCTVASDISKRAAGEAAETLADIMHDLQLESRFTARSWCEEIIARAAGGHGSITEMKAFR